MHLLDFSAQVKEGVEEVTRRLALTLSLMAVCICAMGLEPFP